MELEGELELQKQESDLKISELESQLRKLEEILLHDQIIDADWGDDDERVRMKGFMQDRQVTRERDKERHEIEKYRVGMEREVIDYSKEIEEEERKKQSMKDAFVFAKERQLERAEIVIFSSSSLFFYFFFFS